ncbi:MAG: hypothetical protein AAF541_05825 [Pseudomonadota bacterium]
MSDLKRKKLLFIHGRGVQPDRNTLVAWWRRCVLNGMARQGQIEPRVLENLPTDLFYYADRTQVFYPDQTFNYGAHEETVDGLVARKKSKDFRRRFYEETPGKSALGEFAFDVAASVGLGRIALSRAIPELARYWDDQSWAEELRAKLVTWLEQHGQQGDDLCVVSHCIGSILAFDCFCSSQVRVDKWITVGSPLGNEAVKGRLLGGVGGLKTVGTWINLSAEDDFVCHDKSVEDDYKQLMETEQVNQISDHLIYNLAVHEEQSMPSHWAGYLNHPRLANELAEWLNAPN